MNQLRSLRVALPAALVSLALASTPVMALQPSVEITTVTETVSGNITDLADRGSSLALTMDVVSGGQPVVAIGWSTDDGATWTGHQVPAGPAPQLESAASVCAGQAIAVYAARANAAHRVIGSNATDLDTLIESTKPWTPFGVVARRPDVACVASSEIAIAWFERISDGYKVVLETGTPAGADPSPQRFSLGMGSPGRGLSVAATTDRVYVAWFDGSTLKVRRFRIGSGDAHTLTSLGTTTIGRVPVGTTPRIGADGSKVVLAYTQGADLRVRRSTDRGVSFSSARTLRNLREGSEVGVTATTVRVKGNLVALGAIEAGGIEILTGKGLGYKSTNGGSTFRRLTTHAGGWVLTAVVKVGSRYRWAEAWDHSLEGGYPGELRFRRE